MTNPEYDEMENRTNTSFDEYDEAETDDYKPHCFDCDGIDFDTYDLGGGLVEIVCCSCGATYRENRAED